MLFSYYYYFTLVPFLYFFYIILILCVYVTAKTQIAANVRIGRFSWPKSEELRIDIAFRTLAGQYAHWPECPLTVTYRPTFRFYFYFILIPPR